MDSLEKLSIELLERTHRYCIIDSQKQIDRIRKHIDRIDSMLSKEIDSRKIADLTSSLKTLISLESDLQEDSIIFYMAQYKPLVNLIEQNKNRSEVTAVQSINKETNENYKQTHPKPDINEIYKKYED